MRCVVCGDDCNYCICEECKKDTDIEKLCLEIADYDDYNCQNELWKELAGELENHYNFRDVALSLADELPSPRREFIKIKCLSMRVAAQNAVPKENRAWVKRVSGKCLSSDELTLAEKNNIKAILLNAYQSDFEYNEAEKTACELTGCTELPICAYLSLIDFYIKTRRYEKAKELNEAFVREYPGNFHVTDRHNFFTRDINNRIDGKTKDYAPADKENKKKYSDFLTSIGIENTVGKTAKELSKISDGEYPNYDKWHENAGFTDFVAYDTETAGFDINKHCILQIGAIKVRNGEISESEEFKFDTFVKPYGGTHSVTNEAYEKTGISLEEAKEKGIPVEEMWKKFVDFVGDDILIGFNNKNFDSPRIRRAGRYGKLKYVPEQFDVMEYAVELSDKAGLNTTGKKVSLDDTAKALNIENPKAHSAYYDAKTTAQIYLELLKLDTATENKMSADDLFDMI